MHRILISVIAATSIVMGLFPAPLQASSELRPLTTLAPVVTLEGGLAAEQQVVLAAVERFVSASMELPDLDIRIHDDFSGCDGHHGLYHREGDIAVIDLCSDRELLVFHEIGHAWEQFTLDNDDRAAFLDQVGAESWSDRAIDHGSRGAEIAADSIAYALIHRPGVSLQTRPLELFEGLVGEESPRIAEFAAEAVEIAANADEAMDADKVSAHAAYLAWQAAQG